MTQSQMYHSIIIDDINTWNDWHLVPETRPLVNPPEVKTNFVEIPGANGTLDFTEALTGAPVYGDRTGSWSFIVMNDYQEWYVLYNAIMNYLHGKKHKVILEDEPDYVYEGRLSVNQWQSNKEYSKITINYVLNPFKQTTSGSVNDWLWDDLTFSTDSYIIYYGSFRVNGTTYKDFYNPTNQKIELALKSTDSIHARYLGDRVVEVDLIAGMNEHTGIFLDPGEGNLVTFTGYGTLTADYYRGGSI